MHRSGTSLAAQMVHALGVPMSSNLLAANEYNERGYFEDSDAVRIHEDLLIALGRPWRGIASTFPLPAGWMQHPATARAREQLREHVGKQLTGTAWAVKDPRMARLLPLWLDLAREMDLRFTPVLCIRSPEAVARSLEHRDRLPLNMGKLLWATYNSEVLEALRGLPMDCVLPYEDWFVEPSRNLGSLTKALGVSLSPERSRVLATTVLAADLQHHKETAARTSGWVGELFALLQSWASTGHRPDGIDQVLGSIRESAELHAPWQDAHDSGFLAATEANRAADHQRAVADATRYLAAYQEADRLREETVEALQRVVDERDALLAQARDNLQAYQRTEQARNEVLEQARKNLDAYQQADRARKDAVDAVRRLERERDDLLAKANEHLLAYQATDRDRKDALAQADQNLRAYHDADRMRADLAAALVRTESERDAVLARAQEYLAAYQAADRARLEAIEAMHKVEHERDAVVEQAQAHLAAYRTTEEQRLQALQERDNLLGRVQELTDAWQEVNRKWKATLCYRVASHPLLAWRRRKRGS